MAARITLAVLIVFGLVCLFFCFYPDLSRLHEKRHFRQSVYKTLSEFVNENDFLLLNDVKLYLDPNGNEPTKFDHILLADKYVYIIRCLYAQGGVGGNIADRSIFNYSNSKKKHRLDNPVLLNEASLRLLENALAVSHEDKLFVSVVIYNNSLLVPQGFTQKQQGSWCLPLKEVRQTILEAEKDDVALIRHESTEQLALQIQQQSEKTKTQEEKIRQYLKQAQKETKKKK